MNIQKISAPIPYERSIPEIFGMSYLFDRGSLLASENTILTPFVAQDFHGRLMFGQDNIINFFPSDNITLFQTLVENNDEIRFSEALNSHKEDSKTSEDIIIPLMRPGFDIYGHWLLDLLPKLSLFERNNPDVPFTIVVDERCPSWALNLIAQVATMATRVKKIKTDEIISGRFFLTAPIRRHDFISEMCQLDILANRELARGTRKIYISRKHMNLNHRQLTNSARIERLFKAKGFELIYPEELSIDEQIKLFSETSVLAGEAGSGLHNSIFCPQSVIVINLQSGRQNHFIQSGLCHWYSQYVVYVFGKTETDDWGSSFKIKGVDARAAIARADKLVAAL